MAGSTHCRVELVWVDAGMNVHVVPSVGVQERAFHGALLLETRFPGH